MNRNILLYIEYTRWVIVYSMWVTVTIFTTSWVSSSSSPHRRFIKFPRLSSLALCQETRERERGKKRILYSPPSDDDECNNNSVATLANFLSFRRHSHQCTLLLFTILACPVLLSDTHNALYYAMISILLLPWMELNWRTEEEDRRWIFPSWSHAHSSPWRHRCTHL